MSTITDKKITDGQRNAVWVQHQQDRLTGTPQQNKAVFDEYSELIREHFNEAMDVLDERISTNDSDIEQLKETDAGAAATSARESAASASESAQATQDMLGRVISISNKIYTKSWDVEQEQDEFVFTAEGYTYNESDTYEVFVNGLKLYESEYTRNEDSVVLGSSISAGNTVEIIVTTNLKGKGIANTELNDDYTLTITYDDGTSDTTESIRGEKGEKGDTGDAVSDGSLTTAKYKNGSVTNEKLSEDVADVFFDDVLCTKYRANETDCYYVTIPLNDEDGNVIEPYMAYSETETPAEYARQNGTTLTCNGSLNLLKDNDTWQTPNVLSRGEIIFRSDFTGTPMANDAKYLSINEDRSFTEYSIGTTASQLLSSGAYTVFPTYFKLVENGQPMDLSNVTGNEDGVVTEKNPRLAIGIKADKTIVMFACDGRTASDAGLTSDEVSAQLVSLGCTDAWMMDGGGSTSLNYQCCKVNRNIDNGGSTDRMIRFTFNIKKDVANDFIVPTFAKIGEEKQKVIQQIIPYVNQSLISSSTTENILDYAVNYKGSFKILYYLGDDFSWLPDRASAFKYGLFVIDKHYGGEIRVTASSYNGRLMATNVWRYDTKEWSGWIKIGHVERGTMVIGSDVPAGGSLAKYIYIDNPIKATDYVVSLAIEGSSWLLASVSGISQSAITVNIRNFYTSATGASAKIHWVVNY